MVCRVITVGISLTAALAVAACDAPWAGPTLPPNGHVVTATMLPHGPYAMAQGIAAALTLTALRASIPSCDRPTHPNQADACWTNLAERPGQLYVAVLIESSCTQQSKDEIALAGHDLYFIHWLGRPNGVCNAALAVPSYQLYDIKRSDLPRSGTLNVILQVQSDADGSKNVVSKTQVVLPG